MDSCAASCCTCSLKASYVSAISASWPIGDAPLSCRFAFDYSAQRRNRRLINTPQARAISGVVLSVVDRWWSSKDSPLPISNFVLHRWPLRHETTFSNSNSSPASACSALLRLAAIQIAFYHRLSTVCRILFRPTQFPLSSVVLYCTASAALCAASPNSIPIRPASAATTSGFLLTTLSNARRAPCPTFTLSQKRASDKVLASYVR